MRQLIFIGAMASMLGLASGTASAQGVGVYIGPSYGYDSYYGYGRGPVVDPYGPRVYGYTRRFDDADVELGRNAAPGGCGTYRFWNGRQCVDARYR